MYKKDLQYLGTNCSAGSYGKEGKVRYKNEAMTNQPIKFISYLCEVNLKI